MSHILIADSGTGTLTISSAKLQSRYSFTAQFVVGAELLARRADEIEVQTDLTDAQRAEHRSLVVGAIMQAAAALESEFAEITQHGPGHHLASSDLNREATAFIKPLAPLLDRCPGVVDKWGHLLHLLGKPPLERDRQPTQDAELLVDLRNELVHYRSHWGGQTKKVNLLQRLRSRGFKSPAFLAPNNNEFPHHVLVAACAHWACRTATHFLDEVYIKLDIQSALEGYRRPGAAYEGIIPP